MNSYDKLKIKLEQVGQDHLLAFWNELTDDEKDLLARDINEIDFEQVFALFAEVSKRQKSQEKLDSLLRPVPPEIHGSLVRTNEKVLQEYRDDGLQEIGNGHVGVILLAGGQGTRLGSKDPKGMYNVKLPSNKTLFQIQAQRILRLQSLAKRRFGKNGSIVWYIMTSCATKDSIERYFHEKNYFGLDKSNIVMFEQGTLPCFDFEGKILLDRKHRVSKAPDGNGGLYKALRDEKILEDMTNRGIKYLHAFSVDNILVRVADPVFIGYCMSKGADCAAKVIEKVQPNEALGVVCDVNGKFQVVEYSEITSATTEKRNPDNRLTFNAGSICNHLFTTEFLKNVCDEYESELKAHEARKKIPFVREDGTRVEPVAANGMKIEKFIFDVFPFSKNFVIWEVPREEEFSPLKNGENSTGDNPETARRDVYRLHREFITKAGGKVVGDGACEVSPLLSYAGEGLKEMCAQNEFVTPVCLYAPQEQEQNGYH